MKCVAEVTDETFDADVLSADMPVVVDFWASWCKPCLAIAPWMEAFASELLSTAKVVKANVEDNAKAVADFRITGLPTVLVFVNGQVVSRQNITAQREGLRDWIFEAVGARKT